MNRRNFLYSAVGTLGTSLVFSPRSMAEATDAAASSLPPAIAALKDRKSEMKPISAQERLARLERARELMRQHKLEAICLAGGTSLNYFTGIRWGNSERFFGYVMPQKGEGFFVCPFFEEGRVREQLALGAGMKDPKIYTWLEDENPYKLTANGLKDLGITSGSFGIEEKVPFVFADELSHIAPALHIASATPVTAGCRMVKSPAELALMKLASSITLQVYEAVWRSTRAGMTNRDFTGMISAAYAKVGFPGESSCQIDAYTALPHGSMQPQVIREGSIVLIDDGCIVGGYQSDLSRTFVIGKATDKMKRNFDIVHKAQAAALAAVRPGAECQSVDVAARKVIADAGYGANYEHFTHRLGHGLGMDMHEWPYLVRGNNTQMQAGMTFSNEPGIYIEGEFGIRLEDDMYVTENGGALFTPQSPSIEDPFATA